MSIKSLRGVIPPVPTILTSEGRFDPQGMGILIDRLLASDINGFLFLGSAGEFTQFSSAERKEIAEFCVSRVAGRRPGGGEHGGGGVLGGGGGGAARLRRGAGAPVVG